MSSNTSTRTYRINVNNAAYAIVSANTSTTYTVGAKVALPGVMSVDVTPVLSSGQLYGDGLLSSKLATLAGATVKFDSNKIAIEDRAAILNQTYGANGILKNEGGKTSAEIAFYFEVPSDNGTKEQIWFLVGKAQPFGMSVKQSEDSISYSTDSITMDFKPRAKDNMVYFVGDTANADFTSATSTSFAASPDVTV